MINVCIIYIIFKIRKSEIQDCKIQRKFCKYSEWNYSNKDRHDENKEETWEGNIWFECYCLSSLNNFTSICPTKTVILKRFSWIKLFKYNFVFNSY